MGNKKNQVLNAVETLNDRRVKLLIQLLAIKEDANMTRIYSTISIQNNNDDKL